MSTDTINIICSILTAIGTVGAVIVALWFGYIGYKDKKPKLSVSATISVLYPDENYYLLLHCVNVGNQSIVVTNFALTPDASKPLRIMIHPSLELKNFSTNPTPATIGYSENIQQYFNLDFLKDEIFSKIVEKYRYKWIAKIHLKRSWRIIARTNIKEFEGKLSKSLIDKILTTHFCK